MGGGGRCLDKDSSDPNLRPSNCSLPEPWSTEGCMCDRFLMWRCSFFSMFAHFCCCDHTQALLGLAITPHATHATAFPIVVCVSSSSSSSSSLPHIHPQSICLQFRLIALVRCFNMTLQRTRACYLLSQQSSECPFPGHQRNSTAFCNVCFLHCTALLCYALSIDRSIYHSFLSLSVDGWY